MHAPVWLWIVVFYVCTGVAIGGTQIGLLWDAHKDWKWRVALVIFGISMAIGFPIYGILFGINITRTYKRSKKSNGETRKNVLEQQPKDVSGREDFRDSESVSKTVREKGNEMHDSSKYVRKGVSTKRSRGNS